jgi:hypothetical protein
MRVLSGIPGAAIVGCEELIFDAEWIVPMISRPWLGVFGPSIQEYPSSANQFSCHEIAVVVEIARRPPCYETPTGACGSGERHHGR